MSSAPTTAKIARASVSRPKAAQALPGCDHFAPCDLSYRRSRSGFLENGTERLTAVLNTYAGRSAMIVRGGVSESEFPYNLPRRAGWKEVDYRKPESTTLFQLCDSTDDIIGGLATFQAVADD